MLYALQYTDTEMHTSKLCVDDAGEPIVGSRVFIEALKADMDATRKYPWSRYDVVSAPDAGDYCDDGQGPREDYRIGGAELEPND